MTVEFSLLFALVVVLIAIILLILMRQKKTLTQKDQDIQRLQKDSATNNKLKEEIELLRVEHEALLQTNRNIKFQLIRTAKRSHDLTRMISNLDKRIQKSKEDQSFQIPINDILRILDKPPENQDTFQIHMDDINQQFIHKLKTLYPNLTIYDLRLCTYIKTGLSTKEIAKMINVLPSSINVSRSRLRKKLALEPKDDLYTFLENLK